MADARPTSCLVGGVTNHRATRANNWQAMPSYCQIARLGSIFAAPRVDIGEISESSLPAVVGHLGRPSPSRIDHKTLHFDTCARLLAGRPLGTGKDLGRLDGPTACWDYTCSDVGKRSCKFRSWTNNWQVIGMRARGHFLRFPARHPKQSTLLSNSSGCFFLFRGLPQNENGGFPARKRLPSNKEIPLYRRSGDKPDPTTLLLSTSKKSVPKKDPTKNPSVAEPKSAAACAAASATPVSSSRSSGSP